MADVMLGEKQMRVLIDLREHGEWTPENPTWQHPDGAYKTEVALQHLKEHNLAYKYDDGSFKPVPLEYAPQIRIRKTPNGGKRVTRGTKVRAKKSISSRPNPNAELIEFLKQKVDHHRLLAEELEQLISEIKAGAISG